MGQPDGSYLEHTLAYLLYTVTCKAGSEILEVDWRLLHGSLEMQVCMVITDWIVHKLYWFLNSHMYIFCSQTISLSSLIQFIKREGIKLVLFKKILTLAGAVCRGWMAFLWLSWKMAWIISCFCPYKYRYCLIYSSKAYKKSQIQGFIEKINFSLRTL